MLHVYFITTPTLTQRTTNIQQVIQWIKQQADKVGLGILFHSLAQPTTDYLQELIQAKHKDLEERLQPKSNAPHPIYGKFETPLNLSELSNYERHRTALEAIRTASPDAYHLVLEDDLFILPAFEAAWLEFFQWLNDPSHRSAEVSLALLTMTQNTAPSTESFRFLPYATTLPLTEQHPLLPSKEIYLIHPTAAAELYDYTRLIHCDFRHTLSRWIYTNVFRHATMVVPSKRLSFDGSKLGMFPSSIHANNLLIFNQEFMEMLRILATPDKKHKATVQRLYKTIERLQSPDAMHLYAVLMYQLGDHEEADAYFKKAIEAMTSQKGFLSRGSELLHNAIEFYKHYQKEDVESAKTKPPRHRFQDTSGSPSSS